MLYVLDDNLDIKLDELIDKVLKELLLGNGLEEEDLDPDDEYELDKDLRELVLGNEL